MLRREIARHHTVAYSNVKRPGYTDRKIHVLYVLNGVSCQPTPVVQLIEYCYEKGRTRSLSWQKEVTRAAGLFVDFLKANAAHFRDAAERPLVFEAFADALVGGTIELGGDDPTGLWWEPKTTARATMLLRQITNLSDWLVTRYSAKALNPWTTASWAEQIAYWRRFDRRHAAALLAHTAYREAVTERAKASRTVKIPRKNTSSFSAPVKCFPEERIWDLLFEGFVIPGKAKSPHFHERYNVRDMLVTVLLHGGGLRESEPFHLFVSDVLISGDSMVPHVRLYHPEQGKAPLDYLDPITGRPRVAEREEYLRVNYGLQPRNLVEGRFHAGWKDLHLSDERDKFAKVHWFPSYWGDLFLALFRIYIASCRSRHSRHPYLLVSGKGEYRGEPYTVDSYRQSHARAVKRIGLTPAKALGTTPHGHRHAFGQRLSDNDVPQLIIQRVMHHKSRRSQEVYTAPSDAKVDAALRDAQTKLSGLPASIFDQIEGAY
ncbi:site-specific integrase [Paraburkholderia guartelaensis]|uniref:Site-specific integrase n=1 Tax=Paraburkholderia guartelaensis TaxID=2546446 RepID=A0A4R5L857_9BURK|nr:gamma-mobile-trio recombinase GmtY [Paraburkholderia guartelaensis]TDG03936.1 site-specific integrase [Paraburkholderia guartelaensis]